MWNVFLAIPTKNILYTISSISIFASSHRLICFSFNFFTIITDVDLNHNNKNNCNNNQQLENGKQEKTINSQHHSQISRRNSTGSTSSNGMNSNTAAINLQSSAGHQRGYPANANTEWTSKCPPTAPARQPKRPAPQPCAVQQQPQYQTAMQAHNHIIPPLPPHVGNVSENFFLVTYWF